MKQPHLEFLARRMREYHRHHPWRLSVGGLYIPHSYENMTPASLSYWDDVGFILHVDPDEALVGMARGERVEGGAILAAYVAPGGAQAGNDPDVARKRVQQLGAVVMLKGQAAHGRHFTVRNAAPAPAAGTQQAR